MPNHGEELYHLARLHQHDLLDSAERRRSLPRRTEGVCLDRLSRRERDVLNLLIQRYSDREIADALFVSYRTITTHVAHIFNKLGVSSRREAAAVARLLGFDG